MPRTAAPSRNPLAESGSRSSRGSSSSPCAMRATGRPLFRTSRTRCRRPGHAAREPTLTVDGYERSGGIHGAIAQSAEDAFQALPPAGAGPSAARSCCASSIAGWTACRRDVGSSADPLLADGARRRVLERLTQRAARDARRRRGDRRTRSGRLGLAATRRVARRGRRGRPHHAGGRGPRQPRGRRAGATTTICCAARRLHSALDVAGRGRSRPDAGRRATSSTASDDT